MCVPVLVACYSYSVIPVETVAPGAIVRARVTPAEAARIAEEIGREARVLEGEVLEHHNGGILLAVSSTLGEHGRSAIRAHQRLAIPCGAILELETRRLDRLKTSGVVALAAGVAAYVGIRAFASEGDPSGDGKGGPNQRIGRP